MSQLAILGGPKTNQSNRVFEWHHSFDQREKDAVLSVLDSGVLSDFHGSPNQRFWGGERVRSFEEKWREYFEVEHAVSMNSATSALYAAVGACGIGPGDEVIVPPLTMSATAMAVLMHGGIPVFADLEPDYFCLDPKCAEKLINKNTRAILAVNLFGQAADLTALQALADKHDLWLIEDNAQAPGGLHAGAFTGTIGDIGVFSLNCHKAIQCGEGGVAITRDKDLAFRMQMIRNHAEAVVKGFEVENLSNMIGHNFRLTEISAAIAEIQLTKLKGVNERKVELFSAIEKELSRFEFLKTAKTRPNSTHVYYLDMVQFDTKAAGISREKFVNALNAEGFKAVAGYVDVLYNLPVFQKKVGFGSKGYPFTCEENKPLNQDYTKQICPVAERLTRQELVCLDLVRYRATKEDVATLGKAIEKVMKNKSELA